MEIVAIFSAATMCIPSLGLTVRMRARRVEWMIKQARLVATNVDGTGMPRFRHGSPDMSPFDRQSIVSCGVLVRVCTLRAAAAAHPAGLTGRWIHDRIKVRGH